MFMTYDLASLEVLWLSSDQNQNLMEGMAEIEIPDELAARLVARTVVPDGSTYELITLVGTILTQEEIDRLAALKTDKVARVQVIETAIAGLVGQNVTALTDQQRWILVAAVFYKLGVITSSGIISPCEDWLVAEGP